MAMILGFKQMWWQLKVVIANLLTPREPAEPPCPTAPVGIEQDYCPVCGKLVPVDQMGWVWDRYLCVRCARGRRLSDGPVWR
ncbi:MAG TPA: hypothetical protein VEF72_30140 [Mycobacterium sp.]|nr:hypothetical protein [Mycobacterium sp.]